MPPIIIPLYYQLLQAYKPSLSTIPQPVPTAYIQSTDPSSPSSNVKIALLGDSMIDTLDLNLCQKSFNRYFPHKKIEFLKYGYGATNIDTAPERLTQNTTYLDQNNPSILSLNPDIIVVESFAYNNFGNTSTGIDRHTEKFKEIVKIIQENNPETKILLSATIAPNSLVYAQGIKNLKLTSLDRIERTSTIKLYLENTINFAQKNNLPLADTYHQSLMNNNGILELIDPSSYIHPSPLGIELYCDSLAKSTFDNQLIK